MADIDVECAPANEGWACRVVVRDGLRQTSHTVRVQREDASRLDPTSGEPTDLVRRSFEFLLEHESSGSILRSFDLIEITRYFPDYEAKIATSG